MNKKKVTIISEKIAKNMFPEAKVRKNMNRDKIVQVIGKSGTNEIVEIIEIDTKTKKEKIIFQNLKDKQVKYKIQHENNKRNI